MDFSRVKGMGMSKLWIQGKYDPERQNAVYVLRFMRYGSFVTAHARSDGTIAQYRKGRRL